MISHIWSLQPKILPVVKIFCLTAIVCQSSQALPHGIWNAVSPCPAKDDGVLPRVSRGAPVRFHSWAGLQKIKFWGYVAGRWHGKRPYLLEGEHLPQNSSNMAPIFVARRHLSNISGQIQWLGGENNTFRTRFNQFEVVSKGDSV